MGGIRWSRAQLIERVIKVKSIRQLLISLGLEERGGNYRIIQRHLHELRIDISHFTGKGWRRGSSVPIKPGKNISQLLVRGSSYQSHKLKLRLFKAGMKPQQCEECGWSKRALDGRLPLELDHINGNNQDNRLENLRILCPNCHSLKPTHRGKNKKLARVAERYTLAT